MRLLFDLLWLLVTFPSATIAFSSTASSTSKNALYIDPVINAISTASSEPADALMSLNLLRPKAALVMKALVPIGAFVLAELNPEPESEEYKQLMDLKNRMNEIWQSSQRAIKTSTKVMGAKIMTNQYFVKVIHPINVMKGLTNDFINPVMFKTKEFVAGYRNVCTFGEKAPNEILKYLVGRLVTYCNDPVTPREAQKLADQRAYLMNVLLRLQVIGDQMPDIGIYLKEFLAIYARLEDKDVLDFDILNVFNRRFATYSAAFREFFQELRRRGSIEAENEDESEETCFLRELVYGSNFHHPHSEAFALQLGDQLIDLSYIAGICANLIFDGHAPSVEMYIGEITDIIALISAHTAHWLNTSLESAWSAIHQEILREQLLRIVPYTSKATKDNLKVALELALPLLVETGTPNFLYQGLIAEVAGKEHYFDGLDEYCAFRNIFGFDTVLSRMPLNFTNELEKERVHAKMLDMAHYALSLNATIQDSMKQLYNAKNLTNIATTLKTKMGAQVISDKNFHCWSVLRAYAAWPWESCPTIEYTKESYGYGELRGTATLSYQNKGGFFEVCEIFRFTFFM